MGNQNVERQIYLFAANALYFNVNPFSGAECMAIDLHTALDAIFINTYLGEYLAIGI